MKIKVIDFGYKNLPNRAHYNDAGADVYACWHTGEDKIVLKPNSSTKIPLGFGLELPDGIGGFVFPRSGLSSKGITCELPPVDSGYRGEIHAIVTNCTSEDFVVNFGDRIGQLVVLPIIVPEFVTELGSDRGTGAFESTGRK